MMGFATIEKMFNHFEGQGLPKSWNALVQQRQEKGKSTWQLFLGDDHPISLKYLEGQLNAKLVDDSYMNDGDSTLWVDLQDINDQRLEVSLYKDDDAVATNILEMAANKDMPLAEALPLLQRLV